MISLRRARPCKGLTKQEAVLSKEDNFTTMEYMEREGGVNMYLSSVPALGFLVTEMQRAAKGVYRFSCQPLCCI